MKMFAWLEAFSQNICMNGVIVCDEDRHVQLLQH